MNRNLNTYGSCGFVPGRGGRTTEASGRGFFAEGGGCYLGDKQS